MALVNVKNKSEAKQMVPLIMKNGDSHLLYYRKSVTIDESLVTPQMKNLEEQKILKIKRV